MAQTALDKQTHALMGLYLKVYEKRYSRQPVDFNRYRDKRGFQSMIEDLGVDDAKRVVEYYLTSNRPGHKTQYLVFNYDKLYAILKERDEDEQLRERLRQETKKRVKEMEISGDEGS